MEQALKHCATDGCETPATHRFVAGDVGSDYCADCYSIIVANHLAPAPTPTQAGATIEPWSLAGYAPGNYLCKCNECGGTFEGDKRAWTCLECAVVRSKRAAAPAPAEAGEVEPMADLIELLQAGIPAYDVTQDGIELHDIDAAENTMLEAAASIASLRAEVERWAAVANREDECRQMWQARALAEKLKGRSAEREAGDDLGQ